MELGELNKRLAFLEFVNDQLTSEVAYVDELLKEVGFCKGLDSVKQVAHELLEQGELEQEI